MLRATVRWGLFPSLYGASALFVFVVPTVLIVLLSEPTWRYVEILVYILVLMVIGLVLLVAFSIGIVRVDRLPSPGILDHVRYCALLYACLSLLGLFLASSYDEPSCCTQWSMAAILSLMIAYAILLNALTIYATRWRRAVTASVPEIEG